MARVDAHYTPSALAASIATIGLEAIGRPKRVIDIACGDGALLEALSQRSSACQVYGIDVDDSTVAALSQRRPDWLLSTSDALSPNSVALSRAFDVWGMFDLALLNPPFSCRGQRTLNVRLDGLSLRCSPHMAFVLVAISSLSLGGRLVAILPSSARSIVRDSVAWSVVDGSCTAVIRSVYPQRSFPKVSAGTELHVIDRDRSWLEPGDGNAVSAEPCNCYAPIRGWLQMHAVVEDAKGPLLVHSSNLVDGEILVDSMKRVATSRSLTAPAVLLPRVGRPNRLKVAVHRSGEIALSDCVFGIPCMSIPHAERLSARLAQSWEVVEEQYKGSCAPHLTLSSLRAGLCRIEHGSDTCVE